MGQSSSRRKLFFLVSYIKEYINTGQLFRRTHLVTRSTCTTRLVIRSTTFLTIRSTRSTCLPTRSIRLSTRSTQSTNCRSYYN